MSRFADIRVEWRVEQIERDVSRKADSYEVSTLRSNVDSLERICGALRSELDGIRNEFQTLQDQHRETQERLNLVMDKLEITWKT